MKRTRNALEAYLVAAAPTGDRRRWHNWRPCEGRE